MPHAALIAVICVAYFGLMAALFGYLASQVRHHDQEPEQLPDITPREEDPGARLIAA